MEMELVRTTKDDTSTIGKLSINGIEECWTLEDKDREIDGQPVASWKVQNETCIPRGRYKVIIDFSTRFQKNMPHILDVPGFDGIRIHPGNTAVDTDGCVLLGESETTDFIGSSQAAFAKFFPQLEAAIAAGEDCYITIKDA